MSCVFVVVVRPWVLAPQSREGRSTPSFIVDRKGQGELRGPDESAFS